MKCKICSEKFTSKKRLIEHLKDEYENAYYTVDLAVDQLEDLGVKEISW